MRGGEPDDGPLPGPPRTGFRVRRSTGAFAVLGGLVCAFACLVIAVVVVVLGAIEWSDLVSGPSGTATDLHCVTTGEGRAASTHCTATFTSTDGFTAFRPIGVDGGKDYTGRSYPARLEPDDHLVLIDDVATRANVVASLAGGVAVTALGFIPLERGLRYARTPVGASIPIRRRRFRSEHWVVLVFGVTAFVALIVMGVAP